MNMTPDKNLKVLKEKQHELDVIRDRQECYSRILGAKKNWTEFSVFEEALIWAIANNKVKRFIEKIDDYNVSSDENWIREMASRMVDGLEDKIKDQVFMMMQEELKNNWDLN
jgi:hypothetical protein